MNWPPTQAFRVAGLTIAAGIEEYQPGRDFDPKYSQRMLEQAAYFDPQLAPLALQLSGSTAQRFTSWRMVLNAACTE